MHAKVVPDSMKMAVVAATAKWVRNLEYERLCLHGEKEGVLQLLLDKVAKECRPEGQDWKMLRQPSPTQSHQSNGAAEKAVSTEQEIAGAYLAVLKRRNSIFWSDNTLSDASVDDQTRSVDPHSMQCEMRHTNDPVREDSWTENYRKSSPSRSDTLSNEHLIGAAAAVMRSRAVRPFQEPARCVPAALNAMLFTPWSPHSNLACRLRLQRPAYEELIEARTLPR